MTGVSIDNVEPRVGTIINAVLEPVYATNVSKYQWQLNGADIEGATEASYTIPEAAKIGDAYNVIVTDTEGKTFTAGKSAIVTEDVPPEVVVKLTDVSLVAANALELTFDVPEAKDKVTKDDIKVNATDGTITVPVTNLDWAESGETAKATLAIALTNEKEYEVVYGESSVTLTALIGEVASIGITTVEAEVNIDTKIDFVLFDAAGVDVTANEDIANRITIEVSGDTSGYSVTNPKEATLRMDTIGNEAEVTVTYTPEDTTKAPISEVQTVKCVPAKETKGTGVFAVAEGKNVNKNSGAAKFYRGLAVTGIALDEDETEDNIYFYAKDEKGAAISYEEYSAKASDEDVLSVSVDVSEGKYAKLGATGLKVGNSSIVISAEKNGVTSTYIIPVTVRKAGKIKSVKLTTSRTTMTNAIDDRYDGKIEATVYDSNGEDITGVCDINFEHSESTKVGKDSIAFDALADELGANGFDYTSAGPVCVYTADGAKSGKYVINVTASDPNGDTATAQTTITVQALSTDIWNIEDNQKAGKSAAITYDTEMSASSVDEADDKTLTVRMRALAGSKFVGYVNNDGTIGTGAGAGAYVPSSAEAGNIVFTANVDANFNGIKFTTSESDAGTPEVPATLVKTVGPAHVKVTATGETGAAVSEKAFNVAKTGAENTGVTATYNAGVFSVTGSSNDKKANDELVQAVYALPEGTALAVGDILLNAKDDVVGEAGNGYTFAYDSYVAPTASSVVLYSGSEAFTFTAPVTAEDSLESGKTSETTVKFTVPTAATLTASYTSNELTIAKGDTYSPTTAGLAADIQALLVAGVTGAPEALKSVTVESEPSTTTANWTTGAMFSGYDPGTPKSVKLATKAVTIVVDAAEDDSSDIVDLINDDASEIKDIFTAKVVEEEDLEGLTPVGGDAGTAGIKVTTGVGTDKYVNYTADDVKAALVAATGAPASAVDDLTVEVDTTTTEDTAFSEYTAEGDPEDPSVTYTIDSETGEVTAINYEFTHGLDADDDALAADWRKAWIDEENKFASNFTVSATSDAPAADSTGDTTEGYVAASSTVIPNATSEIDHTTGIKHVVKFGSRYSKADFGGALYNSEEHFRNGKYTDNASLADGSVITLDPVGPGSDGLLTFVPSDTSIDLDFAKPGTYTVYFLYHDSKHTAYDGKWAEKTAQPSIKNSLTAPSVTWTKKTTPGADTDSFKEVFTIGADLNNADGPAVSLVSVVDKDLKPAEEDDKGKVVVKYAVVEENIFDADENDVLFLVNVGQTFTVE